MVETPTDSGDGDGGVAEAVAQVEKLMKEREALLKEVAKKDRGNINIRASKKALFDAVAKLIGGDTEEEVLANIQRRIEAAQDGGDDDSGHRGPGTSPPGRTQAELAEINQLKKQVENSNAAVKAITEQLAAKDAEAKKLIQQTLIHDVVTGLEVPPHLRQAAYSYIRDPEAGNFRMDEEGSPIWSPNDPKSGKRTDLPFDKDSVAQSLPKEFLPGKGGGGSGGGPPRQVGSVKLKEMETLRSLVDGPHAQRDYEKAVAGKSENEKAAIQREIQEAAVGNTSE